MSKERPVIGVFDSGVGGLTVLNELLKQVPGADYIYFGDTARLPYGAKSAATVAKYAISAVKYLEEHGAKRIVIACNTACALAYDQIKAATTLPVLGVIEPGAETAAQKSKSKHVLVMATEGTVGSHAYQKALRRRNVEAQEKACPLFVPLVEEGWTNHAVTEQVAHIYLDEALREWSPDVIVLGCTHYPLLKPLLQRMLPDGVALVDSAESTAQAVAAEVGATSGEPTVRFFATDSVEKFRRAGEKFLGRTIENVEHVEMD
jgi:glutamate racemase